MAGNVVILQALEESLKSKLWLIEPNNVISPLLPPLALPYAWSRPIRVQGSDTPKLSCFTMVRKPEHHHQTKMKKKCSLSQIIGCFNSSRGSPAENNCRRRHTRSDLHPLDGNTKSEQDTRVPSVLAVMSQRREIGSQLTASMFQITAAWFVHPD